MGLGWGTAIGKIFSFIPSRVEQIKNEQQRLLDERKKIMDQPPTNDSAARVNVIDERLSQINSILGNKASD